MSFRSMSMRLLALASFTAFLWALSLYPLERSWLGPVLLAYAGLLAWRPRYWLYLLPALLPVLDLAPSTGWFFFEEIDLLLLLTTGFCYWQLSMPHMNKHHMSKPHMNKHQIGTAYLPPSFSVWLTLLALACAIGLWRGLQLLPAIDANAYTNYLSPYNALRIGKAWCWALILLMPLQQAAGPRLEGLQRYLIPGMLTGLFLVACADIRERLLFPGLLNFSSDYRTSAPFSAMHTGGAALDGYLALSFPLLAIWLFERKSVLKVTAALILLPLAMYASLTTFSRGLYAADAIAGMLLAVLLRKMRARHGRCGRALLKTGWLPVLRLFAAAGVTLALNAVFQASGYRGFGAGLVLLAAALFISAQPLPPARLSTILICGVVPAAALLLGMPIMGADSPTSKTSYFLFAGSVLVFVMASIPALMPVPVPERGGIIMPLALAGLFGLMWNTGQIALHSAGPAASASTASLILLVLLPSVLNRNGPHTIQPSPRHHWPSQLAFLLALALIIPVYNSYYASERFGSSRSDLSGRLQHWRDVLHIMDDGYATTVFGMGLGKFPTTYFWRNPRREVPASYRYVDQAGNRYLQLNGAQYQAGYGEMLRMLQMVPVQADTPYLLSFDAWNSGPAATLHVNLCERLLLYPQNCMGIPQQSLPSAPYWRHYQFALQSGGLGHTAGPWRTPVQLEIATEGDQVQLGLDNVSLRDGLNDHELIRNGSFSDGNNYWFFSSDHHHLPWHIKNLALNLYFELGLFGLFAFLALLLSACLHLLHRVAHATSGLAASAWLSSISAFLVVGLFDSLLDVPRLTLLFLLLLCAGVLRPAPVDIPVAASSP